MHSSELRSAQFEVSLAGRPALVTDLLPRFEERSRLGVVVRDDFGAVGASTLLLGAVTAFYDIQRSRSPEGFFRYADFFLFHVGRPRGNHMMLDVFPDHKEVVVADDPEQILRAINDRGITHLVVPDGREVAAVFQPQTLNGALPRIESALVYAAAGRVADADVEIGGNEVVDGYVRTTLTLSDWLRDFEAGGGDRLDADWVRSRLDEVPDEVAAAMLAEREALRIEGRTVESFRRVAVEAALRRLSPNPVEPCI